MWHDLKSNLSYPASYCCCCLLLCATACVCIEVKFWILFSQVQLLVQLVYVCGAQIEFGRQHSATWARRNFIGMLQFNRALNRPPNRALEITKKSCLDLKLAHTKLFNHSHL